jgi:hypothetical protein
MHLYVCGGEKKGGKHTRALTRLAGSGEMIDAGTQRARE